MGFGIGGQSYDFLVTCRYIFHQDDGTDLTIDGEVHIAEATAYNQADPSLLGRDVIEQFALTVVRQSNEVRLEHQT